MQKILIISHDKVGTKMAGPGIRYHYMAEILSKHFDVTLGFFGPEYLPDKDFKRSYNVKHIDVHSFEDGFKDTDAVIALWLSEPILRYCNEKNIIIIIDIYAPVPVESMAVHLFSDKKIDNLIDFSYEKSILDYKKFLSTADVFLCSNVRQLHYWLGFAFGTGEVRPSSYLSKPIYDQFILAPMGIDTKEKLVKTKRLYKGTYKGILEDDLVLVWNGGIYDWYDGVSLMDAMKKVWSKNKKIKVIFPGTNHPNKSLPKWAETVRTRERAKKNGILDKNVFFFDGWFDYKDRINFLLEADGAIYTHKIGIETEFSHRTRVLDHILAKLPTVATSGDYFADLISEKKLGVVARAEDSTHIAEAILELCTPSNLSTYRKNIEKIRNEFDWNNTLADLRDYLLSNPHKIPSVTTTTNRLTNNGGIYIAVKKLTPSIIKKTIIKISPDKIRRKLIGHD